MYASAGTGPQGPLGPDGGSAALGVSYQPFPHTARHLLFRPSLLSHFGLLLQYIPEAAPCEVAGGHWKLTSPLFSAVREALGHGLEVSAEKICSPIPTSKHAFQDVRVWVHLKS